MLWRMTNNPQRIQAALICLLSVLESQQRQIDELSDKLNAIEGAANDVVEGFSERREDLAAEISHAAQHPLADKVDLYAVLRKKIESI